MRLLFYSHDGLGLGHVRRHLAIASALVKLNPEVKILLATSIDEVSNLGLPPNVDTLKLPALKKVANNQYTSRRLGLKSTEILAVRAALLEAVVGAFRPLVVLVDKHPLGVGNEFLEGLQKARAQGAELVLGLRDILDDPANVLSEWSETDLHRWIAELFDRILIYGNRSIFDPIQQYQFGPELSGRTRFCGYVLSETSEAKAGQPFAGLSALRRPMVLATAGGGEDGFGLMQNFVAAARGAYWNGVAITGPLLSDSETKSISELAAASGVAFIKFVSSLPNLFRETDAVVCMGGYNTLIEAASEGLPAICIPRVLPRTEQLLRAQRFEKLGLVRLLHPQNVTPVRLREQIDLALQSSREQIRKHAHSALTLDGAIQAGKELLDCARAAKSKNRHTLVPVSI